MTYRNGMPFAFWCHKVLPLVYDESLSYYEFLCKLAKILQEVMEHDDEQDELIQKCIDDITQILADIESINGEIDSIKEKNVEQDNAIRELGDMCAQLREDITQLADDIGEINHAIAGINDEIDNIKDKNIEQDNAIRGLGDDISTLRHDMETAVDSLEERVRSALSAIDEIDENFASLYDETSTYGAGAIVIFDNDLYECESNTTGEFDPTKWRRVTVDDVYARHATVFAEFANVWNSIAPEFQNYDGTTFYILKGDIVRYLSRLYRANKDITVDHVISEPPFNNDFDYFSVARGLENNELSFHNLSDSIANEYDENSSYNLGDHCMYDNALYECLDNNVTGDWDGSKWTRVTVMYVIANSGGGGGGNGNVVVPDWDSTTTYPKYAFVNYNNTLFMSMGAQLGDVPPTNWIAINPIDVDSDSFRVLNVTQNSEYYGAGGYGENALCLHRDSNGGVFLKKALYDTQGTYNPSDWLDTDLTSEFITLRKNAYWNCADTYDSTKVYNTGDIIIHIDEIMECTADGVTGAYDFHYWTQTTIFEALAKVINKTINLNLYNGNIVNRFSTNVTEGV